MFSDCSLARLDYYEAAYYILSVQPVVAREKRGKFSRLGFFLSKNWKGVRTVKKYRKLACILAGSMTMSLFAGCIGNGDVVPEEKNESTDTEEPTASETSQEIKKLSPDIDPGSSFKR